jgi:Mn2+/Fe2+ NRAMP family transporter
MRIHPWKKVFGPGLLFASTAIGVSHLVQSTRAGADYGFALIWVVLLANLLKYPFFEFGIRYAVSTGNSLVEAYRSLGKWALWILTITTFVSMFAVTAAVSFVCAGIVSSLFPEHFGLPNILLLLYAVVAVILVLGRFAWLDRIVKLVAATILISTLVAFVVALWNFDFQSYTPISNAELFTPASVAFLVALVGWMPTAIDISVMSSIWTIEKAKQTQYRPSLYEAVLEFRVGYLITAVTAVFFLALGAMMMYQSGQHFSDNATIFSGQFFSLFTNSLGAWSYPLILAAAISVMFSTVLAVFDGYSRVMSRIFSPVGHSYRRYLIWILVLGTGSYLLATFFAGSLKGLVDFATTISFVIAPVFAGLNMLILRRFVAKAHLPSRIIWTLAWVGLTFLTIFALYYLIL